REQQDALPGAVDADRRGGGLTLAQAGVVAAGGRFPYEDDEVAHAGEAQEDEDEPPLVGSEDRVAVEDPRSVHVDTQRLSGDGALAEHDAAADEPERETR